MISTRLIGIGYNNLLLLQTCANIKTYNCIKSYISTTHRTSKTVQRRLDAPEFLMLQACYATATSSLNRDWSTELSSLADAARRADDSLRHWLERCWRFYAVACFSHGRLITDQWVFIARQHTDARYWYSNCLSVCPWRFGIRWKRRNILS